MIDVEKVQKVLGITFDKITDRGFVGYFHYANTYEIGIYISDNTFNSCKYAPKYNESLLFTNNNLRETSYENPTTELVITKIKSYMRRHAKDKIPV